MHEHLWMIPSFEPRLKKNISKILLIHFPSRYQVKISKLHFPALSIPTTKHNPRFKRPGKNKKNNNEKEVTSSSSRFVILTKG